MSTASIHSLYDESIAVRAVVKPNLDKKLVDDIRSLIYRDEVTNGGIRVRHLSVYNFFVSDCCDYQVNLQDTDVQLGITCLEVMTMQLHFNICHLEDSRLANANIKDLPS